jgi:hypothetical protein
MKFNKWTVGLAAVGVVSLASAARADEKITPLQTALSNTTISGYVDTAATWRPGTDTTPQNGSVYRPGYSYAKNDGFSLNAVDIAIDKPEDESPWAAGYHVEMMFGPDNPVGGYSNYGNLRQGFLRLRMPVGNGIDWQVGVWDTIVGYESNSDPLNPNYTRSYGYTIEPTTHTGILATYKINDMVTVQAGIADGSNVAGGPAGFNGTSAIESQKAYMGDLQFTAPDSAGFMKGATLTVAAIDSAGQGGDPGSTSFYAGATIPTPASALKVGGCFDYLDIHNGNVVGNSGNDSVWNIALYSTFQATDKLSFNLRAEYLDAQSLSAADANNIFTGSSASTYGKNTAEEFTATVQYNLWANVISRAEFRWDHLEHGKDFGQNSAGAPFRNNDFLLALNLIYQF